MTKLRDHVAAMKRRLAPEKSPYLVALHDGSLSKDDFVETQIQFLFAVVHFSRPMAVLAGRLPRPEMRLALFHNVADEHGEGNLGFSHERTFLRLLSRLGVTTAAIDARALWPEVRAFDTLLSGVCTLDDTLTAVATLGVIEDLFSGISASIGRDIVARGFLREDEVTHYATHEVLDVAHADGFYALLDEPFESSPRMRYQIEQGLDLGAYAFLRLYEDLFAARARRATREVRGPHSLADGWYVDEAFAESVYSLKAARRHE